MTAAFGYVDYCVHMNAGPVSGAAGTRGIAEVGRNVSSWHFRDILISRPMSDFGEERTQQSGDVRLLAH